jgi:hypothetical protein
MEKTRKIVAGLFVFTGVVWFLQGINIIPGSFMTGDIRWAVAGIFSLIVGLILWKR